MKKYNFILIQLALSLIGLVTNAQSNVHITFDDTSIGKATTEEASDAKYAVDLLESTFVKGIQGYALDLSSDAVLRRPLTIDSLQTPDYSSTEGLTVSVWVRTKENARQGTTIVSNKKSEDSKASGWAIFTQASGAWGVQLSDGERQYSYKPTAPRQSINDGKWHLLAFSFTPEKGEVWFYLDGKNVGIYNVSGLGSLSSPFPTVVGGTCEYFEWGSNGQWTSFNGYVDECKIQAKYTTSSDISEEYSRFRTIQNIVTEPTHLRTMIWNIWHGGRRYGKHVGVQRVVETIKQGNPDIIGLIETYGSGEIIADSLGYYYYLISSNLSIMSRYPITETVKAFRSFNFGGVEVALGNGQKVIFLDTWLHYLPDYSGDIQHNKKNAKELIKAEGETRHAEVKSILKEVKDIVDNADNVPVLMGGDFNIGSHLDWTEATKAIHYNYVVDWPVSKEMMKVGFTDSYRELHINPLLDPGFTWTPRASTSSTKYGVRDRIDYIYYKGRLRPTESKVIDYHPVMFPSDHAALITTFSL